jgi:hypothetical protein
MNDVHGKPVLSEAVPHEPAPALVLLDRDRAVEVTRELARNHSRPRADVHGELAGRDGQREVERRFRRVRKPVALRGKCRQGEGLNGLLPGNAAVDFLHERSDLVGWQRALPSIRYRC